MMGVARSAARAVNFETTPSARAQNTGTVLRFVIGQARRSGRVDLDRDIGVRWSGERPNLSVGFAGGKWGGGKGSLWSGAQNRNGKECEQACAGKPMHGRNITLFLTNPSPTGACPSNPDWGSTEWNETVGSGESD